MLGRKVTGLGLLSTLVLFVLSLTLFLPLSSCVKNQDSTAVVTIVDSISGKPCAGYSVSLKYNVATSGKTNTVATQTTDGTGTTTFTFKNPAIYDVDVTTPSGAPTFDVGIIKLVQGGSVSQTYIFR